MQQFIDQINGVEITTVSAIFRLVLSLLLGSAVGMERKRKGQIAGIRTFSLISLGATLAMILSIYVPQEYLGLKNGDPGRIAAQVITGIGFLGAGAIIQMKGSVRGLTTAAGIWMTATVGMAIGVGLYVISLVATVMVLFIMFVLEEIEKKIHVGAESRIIRIKVGEIVNDIEPYRTALTQHNAHLVNVFADYDYTEPSTRLNLVVLLKDNTDYIRLFGHLKNLYPTQSISLANQLSI
ncbi:MAG: MgtC/SapB family protein [Paramuribaculum sp.]|nr:MgtC/SapB family protein [Paramuribaculum sp.]